MDAKDRLILNHIQSDFPVATRPFFELSKTLGFPEHEILERTRRLKAEGIIRRVGASLDSRRLRFVSTLCAARVPEEKIEAFTAEVGRFPGVTHNYLRKNKYNVWFTLIATDKTEIEKTLQGIRDRTGIKKILNLPAVRSFKVKVHFEF
ncbi:MAG: Lrp/AsnC family transcriptional regulator [Desulfobacteraceae bacterium]|nr:MAG: Lrp/AsnC family transcriptional regulator [Desulfobacteraceae bacterium]